MESAECIRLLIKRTQELGRLPKKSDFEQNVIARIKRALGPWPRALESAGLKPVSEKKLIKTGGHQNGDGK